MKDCCMIADIINLISTNTPYTPIEIKNIYDKVKSIDLILSVLNLCQKFNLDLDTAIKCIVVSEVMKEWEQ